MSSQLTCVELKLLKQSFTSSHGFVSPFLHLPHSKTPTWSLSFSFDSSLLLALILHYYSSLTLHLTLFLSSLPTLSLGCFLTHSKPLSTLSAATVLTIYLPRVAWACYLLTRDVPHDSKIKLFSDILFLFSFLRLHHFLWCPVYQIPTHLQTRLFACLYVSTSRIRIMGFRWLPLPGCDSVESCEGYTIATWSGFETFLWLELCPFTGKGNP